jgi:hypothetical protein
MAIKYKVGVGGHYTDWADAYNALCAIDPLNDDYEFEQISDVTVTVWPNINLVVNQLDANGHTVRFYCSESNSHQGNPTKGYITYLSGANGKIDMRFANCAGLRPNAFLENLYIRQITNNDIGLITAQAWTFGDTSAINAYFVNMLIRGYIVTSGRGINCTHQDTMYRLRNCKIWNIKIGVYGTAGSYGGLVPADRAINSIIENVTVYNTNLQGINTGLASTLTRGKTFSNCCSFNNALNAAWAHLNSPTKLICNNCADDDSSIDDNGGVANNCLLGIDENNDFESTDDTNPDFLSLKKGALAVSADPTPDKGKAPLRVRFNSDIDYLWPAGMQLYNGGAVPSLSVNDIAGVQYGKYGDYPIGCHNAEVAY